MTFKEWKYDSKNTIPSIRKEYRQYVSNKILDLVNNKPQTQEVLVTEPNILPADNEYPLN